MRDTEILKWVESKWKMIYCFRKTEMRISIAICWSTRNSIVSLKKCGEYLEQVLRDTIMNQQKAKNNH